MPKNAAPDSSSKDTSRITAETFRSLINSSTSTGIGTLGARRRHATLCLLFLLCEKSTMSLLPLAAKQPNDVASIRKPAYSKFLCPMTPKNASHNRHSDNNTPNSNVHLSPIFVRTLIVTSKSIDRQSKVERAFMENANHNRRECFQRTTTASRSHQQYGKPAPVGRRKIDSLVDKTQWC